jgi:hypothetical protein
MNKQLNEELLKRANTILESVSTAVGQAKDFTLEQLPDIAYQYISFSRAYVTFVVVLSIVTFVSIQIATIKWANRSCKDNSYDRGKWDDGQGIPYAMATSLSIVVCFPIILNNLRELFMVWFAPKIFLIERIVTLVKQ